MEKEELEDLFDSDYEKIYRQIMELSERASIDDLTQMLNRRAGKRKLEQFIERGRRQEQVLSVCLYDINELKKVNDTYGHQEGDRLLELTSFTVKAVLSRNDFAFRLSGDEFVIVFYGKKKKEAESEVKQMLESLRRKKDEEGVFYRMSFSYGITELVPGEKVSVQELIARADNLMYLQKRDYHIAKNIEKMNRDKAAGIRRPGNFEYDKEHLYEALVAGTDDDIFVGNLKTGVFRYPKPLVNEFGLPGEIVENASAVWACIVHEDDVRGFLESNQEIADGRCDYHDIQYRAQNMSGEWVWLRCQGKMLRDENGVPDLFAGMITNLGTKKHRSCTIIPTKEISGEVQERLCECVKEDFRGFSAFYRPQFTADGKVNGAEAVTVWHDEAYGMMEPGNIIPILEKAGILSLMRGWIFENAVSQCKKWCKLIPDFQMSVNFSCLQCLDGETITFMSRMIEKYDLSPRHITVELRQEITSKYAIESADFEKKYLKDL